MKHFGSLWCWWQWFVVVKENEALKRYIRSGKGASAWRALIGFNSALLIYPPPGASILKQEANTWKPRRVRTILLELLKIIRSVRLAHPGETVKPENSSQSFSSTDNLDLRKEHLMWTVCPENCKLFARKRNHSNFQLQPRLRRSNSRVLLTTFLSHYYVKIVAFGRLIENDYKNLIIINYINLGQKCGCRNTQKSSVIKQKRILLARLTRLRINCKMKQLMLVVNFFSQLMTKCIYGKFKYVEIYRLKVKYLLYHLDLFNNSRYPYLAFAFLIPRLFNSWRDWMFIKLSSNKKRVFHEWKNHEWFIRDNYRWQWIFKTC